MDAVTLEPTRKPRGPNKLKDSPIQDSAQVKTVRVFAVHGRFVDLIKDVEITTPKLVEWHPWLQANIDAGKLELCS